MAHIWFCPTSVVTMVLSPMNLLISCMTFWGTMGVQQRSGSQAQCRLNILALSAQSLLGVYEGFRASISMRTVLAESHCRLTAGCLCLPNSVASRSMCTTFPSGLFMRLFWL